MSIARSMSMPRGRRAARTSAPRSTSLQCAKPAAAAASAVGDDRQSRPTAQPRRRASAATAAVVCCVISAARAAVVEDVGELVGLGRRVDRAEDGAGLEHGEDRDHRLGTIVQEHDDAIAARDAARGRGPAASRSESVVELAIGQALARPRPARSCPASARRCRRRNSSTRMAPLLLLRLRPQASRAYAAIAAPPGGAAT